MKYKKQIAMLLVAAMLFGWICVEFTIETDAVSWSADRAATAGGSSFSNATTLTLNSPASVNISSDTEPVYFKFTPTQTGFYSFNSFGNQGDPVVSLYNMTQQFLQDDDDSAGSSNFRITYHLVNGHTYYFEVGAFDEEGANYQVELRKASTAVGLVKTSINEGVSYSYSNQKYGQMVCFTYTPPVTKTFTLQSALTSGNPSLWIYNSQFQSVGTNDDGGSGNNFRKTIMLTQGTQYFIVVGNISSTAGSYNVILLRPADIENRFYRIQNVDTSQYLDIHGPNAQELVHQWTTSTGEQQKWLIQKQADGYYTIRSQYGDNKYVGISNTNTGESNIVLSDEITDYTRWNIYVTYNNKYIFEPKMAAEKSLYAPNTSTGSEMQLIQTSKGGNKEQWALIDYDYTGLTFSAFDVSDLGTDINEAEIMKAHLESFGYTCVEAESNNIRTVSGQLIRDIGRYTDIVYINSHGYPYANIVIHDENAERIEYFCAEDAVEILRPTDDLPKISVGAEWLDDSRTKTDSYWNVRTKWVILSPCSQLNYTNDSSITHWDGLTSAEVWARTMLGDGHRIHGILGFYYQAPKGTDHTSRLDDFFSDCQNAPLVEAWGSGHTRLIGSSSWAALFHYANMDDTLTNMSATTASGSNYVIYYVGRNINLSLLSLAGQNRTSIPDITALGEIMPILISSSVNKRTNMQKYMYLQEKLQGAEKSVLNIDEDGRITYSVGNRDWGNATRSAYSLTEAQAINAAEKILADLDLLPEDEYQVRVSTIDRVQMNLAGGKQQSPETVEYTVCFYRTCNGIDIISDREDGIIVGISADGLTELQYFWRDMIIENTVERNSAKAITFEQAQSICEKEYQMDMTNWFVSVAYLQINDSTRPVYVFASDDCYTNSVYVDIYTGEVLSMG